METVEAEVCVIEDNHYIRISCDPPISIPISDDNANTVKSAFSMLITRLTRGAFRIELKDTDKDLFYHVAKEYLEQLNGELQEVYEEMKQYDLVDGTGTAE